MKKLPKAVSVSIVIPVYNEQDYIKQCLDSIKHQTVPPDEVIVVDNNCTDDTINIAKKFPFVSVIKEKKQGIHFGRTAGFNAAISDIILKLDADTRIKPTWVGVLKKEFLDTEISSITSHVYFYDGYLKIFDKSLSKIYRGIGDAVFNFFTFTLNRIIGGGKMLYGANYAVRRSVWAKVSSNVRHDLQVWEDLDTALNIRRNDETIIVLKGRYAGVSSRSGLIPLKEFAWRMQGWFKTYWPFNKFSAIIAVGCGLVATIIITMVMIPIRLNKMH
jgi:glycosyltransferase involved in cell wall biosynthesis